MNCPVACVTRATMLVVAALSMAFVSDIHAQTTPQISGTYTCTDANGRKLRSDRPIPACNDREQTVLNPSGTVRAKVGPALSVQQRAELEERKKEEAAEQARLQEERRRDRAMLARYPSRAAHDKERLEANLRVDTVVLEAEKRIHALHDERLKIDRELEFYKGDPTKVPPALQRQVDYVTQSLQSQRRFIQAQENERQRIAARLDEELLRLTELWQAKPRPAGTLSSPAGVKP